MKKVILAGISLCLPAVMLFAACGETKTTSENVSSEAPPISSAAEQADVSSADIVSASSEEIASVVSEAASSTATSSKNKVSSNPPASSKEPESSSSSDGSSSDYEKKYSTYTEEEFEKLDIVDNKVAITIKKEYIHKEFTLADFPEVDGTKIGNTKFKTFAFVFITLKEHSKPGVLKAIKVLEENQYVESVGPSSKGYTH